MDKDLKKFRVGIIGCGRISVRHIGSAMLLPQAELAAVCDIRRERAEAAAKDSGARVYTDYKEMIEKENLDCVHICLPHYLHVPVAEYAFGRKVNVLSEKPMSIKYEDAERAVKTAKENGVLYGVIFQSRYNDASVFVKKALDGGKLGRIKSASSVLTWSRSDDYYSGSDWKGTWDKEGGGVVIDQAIHSIDLVNTFINEKPVRISAGMAIRGHKGIKVEDTAEGLIEYGSGIKYAFYCMNNYACDEPITIKLCCENGKAELSYTAAKITYSDGREERYEEDKNAFRPKDGKDYWGYKHIRQIEQFYKACLKEEPLEISGEEALKTQKIICEIYNEGRKTL